MDSREPEPAYGDVPRLQDIEVVAVAAREPPTDWSMLPLTRGDDDSLVMRALRRMRREPALLFTVAYLLVSLPGLWCSFWFYQGFELSILDYMQPSDFLVAGMRDPVYVLLLLLGVLLVLLVSWPDTLRARNAAKLQTLRQRSMLWRVVLSRSVLTSWDGLRLRALTAMTLAVAAFMAVGAANYVMVRGEQIRNHGRGEVVQLQLNGDAAPLPGTARLLGSSSAFLFVWWPQQRRAEAIPIAAVRKLQALPVAVRTPVPAAPAPGAPR
ncbi:hypothetical protein [Stenotrophomonas sp. YAU14D1_LEIMI4_1]|uniref:hypothetical protein n=1 Tax=Stenotrophomonas sp. YAU14D1_LEIMI4_1 TaxID=2072407 RepID=UPI000D541E97|nr:hypothetical protein [Stenotrophomonas sp. YAU14D1_LEIMI4_1]AWH26208.1 hypothetical protein C1932_14475 [Stenotrophomonas sp. YAU14D1_LEIMI4_1]